MKEFTVNWNNSACKTIRPPKHYKWEPEKDITTYELALCTSAFFLREPYWVEEVIKKMPDEARRHFKEFGSENHDT